MSKNKIDMGGLYKLKEGKSLDIEDYLSKHVRLLGFTRNPLEYEGYYCEFIYVFKDSLEPTSMIHPSKILPYDKFLEYFELDMSSKDVTNLILELELKSIREEFKDEEAESEFDILEDVMKKKFTDYLIGIEVSCDVSMTLGELLNLIKKNNGHNPHRPIGLLTELAVKEYESQFIS
jgi:hypothetical protein